MGILCKFYNKKEVSLYDVSVTLYHLIKYIIISIIVIFVLGGIGIDVSNFCGNEIEYTLINFILYSLYCGICLAICLLMICVIIYLDEIEIHLKACFNIVIAYFKKSLITPFVNKLKNITISSCEIKNESEQ